MVWAEASMLSSRRVERLVWDWTAPGAAGNGGPYRDRGEAMRNSIRGHSGQSADRSTADTLVG